MNATVRRVTTHEAVQSMLRRALPWLVLALALVPLLVPYLQPGYQVAHDREVPYMRVMALRAALAEGQVPPRWFPDFDGGYGSPYPSFYGMLFYYPAAGLNALGVPVGAAVEITAFLTLACAAAAMFVLVRGLWGTRGGLLAAVLYSYAPYHLVNAFVRGAYSELTAFVWFPLILHALYRWVATAARRWLLVGALAIAGLLLTHNLMPMAFLPVAMLFPLLELRAWGAAARDRRLRLGGLVACGALGLLLTAFFWLPIVCERTFVRLDYFMYYDYRAWFTSLRGLLTVAQQHGLTTEAGVLLLGAAGLAAPLALWPFRARLGGYRPTLCGALVVGLGYLFMTIAASAPLWARVPPLAFMQFPWRLLAPATFFLCVAAGALPRLLGRPAVSWALVAALALGAFALYRPLIQIPVRSDLASLDRAAVRAEVWGTQDYRPASSATVFWRAPVPPSDANVLLPAQSEAPQVESGAVTALESARQGSAWRIAYTAPAGAALTVPQFYYPGWRAEVDGAPLAVEPAGTTGLIRLALPAGSHRVRLSFSETPLRRLADGLSLAGAALLALTAFWPRDRWGPVRQNGHSGLHCGPSPCALVDDERKQSRGPRLHLCQRQHRRRQEHLLRQALRCPRPHPLP